MASMPSRLSVNTTKASPATACAGLGGPVTPSPKEPMRPPHGTTPNGRQHSGGPLLASDDDEARRHDGGAVVYGGDEDEASGHDGGGAVLYGSPADFNDFKQIYRGPRSLVWTCICKATRATVVLKAYEKQKMTPGSVEQPQREVELSQMASSKLQTAVRVLGHFETEKHFYIVQEFCTKGDLFKRMMKAGGILPERVITAEIILPLLYALDKLHEEGIVHRDIKPENIFFNSNGSLRLGDFGLAIDMSVARATARVGTLDYMAPEVVSIPTSQAARQQNSSVDGYGSKVDVWAVGVLAYELLVGRPPFEVESEERTAYHIQHSNVADFPCYISNDARSFVTIALTKDPKDRPSARDIAAHPWLQSSISQYLGRGNCTSPTAYYRAARSPICPSTKRALVGAAERSTNGQSLHRSIFLNKSAAPPPDQAKVQQDAGVGMQKSKSMLRRNHSNLTLQALAPSMASMMRMLVTESRGEPASDTSLSAVAGDDDVKASTSEPNGSPPHKLGPHRGNTCGPEMTPNLEVLLPIDELEELRKLGNNRSTSVRNRIVEYFQGR